MGINHIIVESDSAVLASLIHSSEVELYALETLVLKSLQLMSSFKTCNVTHVHREREHFCSPPLVKGEAHPPSQCLTHVHTLNQG